MATQVKHRRGTAAEIAAGTPAIGELWFNTTDNTIHMGNGATQGGIKQTAVTNVKNYGALGDGTTDDSSAIQAAFDAAENGAVVFPPGTYFIGTDVLPKSNTRIIGMGGVLKLGGHEAVMLLSDVENILVDGLTIDGNRDVWTSVLQYVLPIIGCDNVTVQNCHIYNGHNAGVGVGQQLAPDYNKNIKILNNHIHDIGVDNFPAFTSYGNGIAVTGGEDIIIQGNTVHDIHQVGFINCEGTLLKNIKILANICYNSTGRAAGIKCFSSGVDVPAENVIIRDNTLYNIGKVGDPDAANTEPTIWVEAGDGVRVIDNDVIDCPAVGKAGIISVTSDSISTVKGNTIRDCDGGRMEVFSTRDIKVLDNTIVCTATSTLTSGQAPLYVESFSTEEGTCRVSGNTIREAPYASIVFNPRSKGILTENMIVNPNRVGGNYGIQETFAGGGFSYSIIGNNVIIDDGSNNLGVAFYNFSSGDTVDMIYKADSWDVDVSFNKYDVGVTLRFIQTDVPLIAASNPTPTTGYNERGRVIHTANPQAGNPSYYVCVAAGTPGTWLPGPNL